MKYFLLLCFIFFNRLCFAQSNCPLFDKYIAKGDNFFYNLKTKEKYRLAIKAYNAAQLHCPEKAQKARLRIQKVFEEIQRLKDIADYNLTMAIVATKKAKSSALQAEKEKRIADTSKKRAEISETIAKEALKISEVNNLLYEAQGMVKYDANLALHLADTALKIFRTIKNLKKNDSIITDKATRIYYENNFYTTVNAKKEKDSTGNIIKAIFLNEKIYAITDSAFAIVLNEKGEIINKPLKLDLLNSQYNFNTSIDGRVLLHAPSKSGNVAYGTIWDFENNTTPISIDSNMMYLTKDSIALNVKRDTTDGWATRTFVFGYKAFQFDKDSNLVFVFSGLDKNIKLVSFSPDGKYIATNDGGKSIKLFDTKGKLITQIVNTGGIPKSMQFTIDHQTLFVKQANSLQVYKIMESTNSVSIDAYDVQTIYPPLFYDFQDYVLSYDGNRLLMNTKYNTNQVVFLLQKNSSNKFDYFEKFFCPIAKNTSVAFSVKQTELITSSDKIRLWKIPKLSTEGNSFDSRSQFFTSVEYDSISSKVKAYSITDKIILFSKGDKENYRMDSTLAIDTANYITRLVAFTNNKKVIIVSEDGTLKLYNEKDPLNTFLENFEFEKFTEMEKKRFIKFYDSKKQ